MAPSKRLLLYVFFSPLSFFLFFFWQGGGRGIEIIFITIIVVIGITIIIHFAITLSSYYSTSTSSIIVAALVGVIIGLTAFRMDFQTRATLWATLLPKPFPGLLCFSCQVWSREGGGEGRGGGEKTGGLE